MSVTVLVIDDEPNYRAMIEFNLAMKGFRVLTAERGSIALETLQRERVDLIITDMKMPEMDGLDLILAARKFYPALPVIIMTGYAIEDRLEQTLRLEKTTYLPKPFDIADLDRLVDEAVDETRSQQ